MGLQWNVDARMLAPTMDIFINPLQKTHTSMHRHVRRGL
jgi:hypothetical protein